MLGEAMDIRQKLWKHWLSPLFPPYARTIRYTLGYYLFARNAAGIGLLFTPFQQDGSKDSMPQLLKIGGYRT